VETCTEPIETAAPGATTGLALGGAASNPSITSGAAAREAFSGPGTSRSASGSAGRSDRLADAREPGDRPTNRAGRVGRGSCFPGRRRRCASMCCTSRTWALTRAFDRVLEHGASRAR